MDNESQSNFQWPPLESDPEIFNNYFKKIGLENNVEFQELWSLEYKEVQIIDSQVIGVIAAINRQKGKIYDKEKTNVINYEEVPFFMKQEGSLDNACGLVAALHCFGNNQQHISIINNSILDKFFSRSKDQTPAERCKSLENDVQFKQAHLSSSNEGQSNIPSEQEQVNHHYIAFAVVNNAVVEFDGTLPGPVVIKQYSTELQNESLLDDVIEDLQIRLKEEFITDNLSVMIVVKN